MLNQERGVEAHNTCGQLRNAAVCPQLRSPREVGDRLGKWRFLARLSYLISTFCFLHERPLSGITRTPNLTAQTLTPLILRGSPGSIHVRMLTAFCLIYLLFITAAPTLVGLQRTLRYDHLHLDLVSSQCVAVSIYAVGSPSLSENWPCSCRALGPGNAMRVVDDEWALKYACPCSR